MCICGKNLNLKTIECDTCDTSYHIPCVQDEIVKQKDRITNATPLNPNYQIAYQCPKYNCSGHLSPKENIPYKTFCEYNSSLHGVLIYIDWEKNYIRNYMYSWSGIVLFVYMILSTVLYAEYSKHTKSTIDDINKILVNMTFDEYQTEHTHRQFTVIFNTMLIILYAALLSTYFVIYNNTYIDTVVTLLVPWTYMLCSAVTFGITFNYLGDIRNNVDNIDVNNIINYNVTANTLVEYAEKAEDKMDRLWLMMSIWLFIVGVALIMFIVLIILCAIVILCHNLFQKLKSCCFKEKDHNKNIILNSTHFV
jgi:hypothetical protein